MEKSRFPAAADIDRLCLAPCAPEVVREHNLYAAIDVGVRQVVVAQLVAPLIGKHYATVLKFDKVGVYIGLEVVAYGGGRRMGLCEHHRVGPCAAVVLTPAGIKVPAEMVVFEGHQERAIGEALDSRIVEVLFGERGYGADFFAA